MIIAFIPSEALKTVGEERAIMRTPRNHLQPAIPRFSRSMKTRTTLIDLIRILNEVVEKGEEKCIPQIVLHMLKTGMVKPVRNSRALGKMGVGR